MKFIMFGNEILNSFYILSIYSEKYSNKEGAIIEIIYYYCDELIKKREHFDTVMDAVERLDDILKLLNS